MRVKSGVLIDVEIQRLMVLNFENALFYQL